MTLTHPIQIWHLTTVKDFQGKHHKCTSKPLVRHLPAGNPSNSFQKKTTQTTQKISNTGCINKSSNKDIFPAPKASFARGEALRTTRCAPSTARLQRAGAASVGGGQGATRAAGEGGAFGEQTKTKREKRKQKSKAKINKPNRKTNQKPTKKNKTRKATKHQKPNQESKPRTKKPNKKTRQEKPNQQTNPKQTNPQVTGAAAAKVFARLAELQRALGDEAEAQRLEAFWS